MSDFPSFLERDDSQASAFRLLARLGYMPITPEETLTARGGYRSRAVLETILLDQLRRRRISHRGHEYTFSADNLRRAVEALRNLPDDGLLLSSAAAHELLVNGKSLEQEIEGERSSFTLQYVDWAQPANNAFHVAAEFTVAGPRKDIRLDLVLFVNGIPFVVIECKRRDDDQGVGKAVADLLGYQKSEAGAPHLFHLAQILIGTQPDVAYYGVTGTPDEQWAVWKEESDDDGRLAGLLVADLDGRHRQSTAQDRTLYALCRPERLLELVRDFILFDAGIKKIARYQQYFAVRRTMERIRTRDAEGRRRGGVVWHTQGSGKSLTMVMLATAILRAPDIERPRIILVTDRIDLDDQLYTTFENTRHDVVKAATGADLLARLESGRGEIITTVIDKYEAAARRREVVSDSPNVFVMIDESHRSQYGKMHARMRKILPNACYLGFTGTPLTRAEKSTAAKFGGIIDAYTIDEAVADHAVVPILYEGRTPKLDADQKPMDREFGRIAESMTRYQEKLAKQRIPTESVLFKSEQVIVEIAADIEAHWRANWQGDGFKAQLATPDKATAIRYHRCFQESGKVTTAVVISAPDVREDEDDGGIREDVAKFWRDLMERYGSEKNYLKSIIAAFKTPEAPEILIVVDKLLVGFDVPRNMVLYNTKSLHAHALLQAIARVNRVFPDKKYGYVIDYRGVLGDLDDAIQMYRALAEFDREDVAHAVLDITTETAKLPQCYSELVDLFADVVTREDISAYVEYLFDEKLRHTFYEKLSAFARTFQIALSSQRFQEETSQETIDRYTSALKFFQSVRRTAQHLYSETVDFRDYEARIRKVMDRHISIDEVVQSTPLVDIFDAEAIQQELEEHAKTPGAKADMIAHRLRRTLTERMEEDPILFARFSQLVQQAIDEYHGKRMAEAEFLQRAMSLRDQVTTGRFAGIPTSLIPKPEARAYYGILMDVLEQHRTAIHPDRWKELMAEAAEKIMALIDPHTIVDWRSNPDVENQIKNDLDDFLYDLKKELGIEITSNEIDMILEKVIEVARTLRPRP